ncbi:uncharacterized protein TRAVEDRAFT_30652 [Trametes versicolor FP-101664 SS1]|uniref:uncharacterized protein n=1 Tax=Trametes versicolor (strain FP-101664) TaxID=717944 RepID=UPI00046241BD|nr:uncharacterized protein TRAVEDRAFT_30652 [Trametes versicolor FP-101664 SS1]EIW56089.1 hypothetical protein TRAVEDRAFT_30652 [Trametes versicolor FP-101664 SS1]
MTDAQAVDAVVWEDIPGDVARAADAVDLPKATSNAASTGSAEIDAILTAEKQDIIELAGTNDAHKIQCERGNDERSALKRARLQPEVLISQPRKKNRPPAHSPSRSSSSPHASASTSTVALPDVSVAASEWYPPEFCRERLRHTPVFSVSLDPTIRDITIHHGAIQKAFGGTWNSSWAVFGDLDRHQRGHNYMRFRLSASRSYHIPPREPGGPGALLLTYNPWPEGPHKVLVKTEDDLYKYMGEYDLLEAEPITVAEFQTLPHRTRRAWGAGLCKLHSNGNFLAAIALQKQFGRTATAQEIAAVLAGQKPEGELAMTAQEVLEAFADGRMILRVWVMQCVGYDEEFQRKIAGHGGGSS